MDSTAVALGADDVAVHLSNTAAAMQIDIDIVRTGSRGAFWLEPLVEFEAQDGRRFGFANVSGRKDAAQVLESFLSHSTISRGKRAWQGWLDDLPFLANQSRLTFANCGVNDPLDLAAYEAGGGMLAARKTLEGADVLSALESSGLRGRGGAGFPAHIKWRTVADQQADQKYVVCNADEGDSGTFADRMLMEGDPFKLLEGMIIAGLTTGATQGFVYVRSEYPDAIKTLKAARDVLLGSHWLGHNLQGYGRRFDIEIRRGAGSYVCGEESAMLDSLEGKRGQVRAKPPIPAHRGLFGRPTLVNNVLSFAAVPDIVARGGPAYAALGQGRSTGTQAYQLSGMVQQPGLIELPFGIRLGDLIETFGGGMREGSRFQAAQIGGPLGAYITDLNIPLTYEDLAAAGGMLGHGGIVVFDHKTDMAQMARFAFEFCAAESCGKCTPCRIGSQRGVEAVDRLLASGDRQATETLITDLCDVMEAGSLCAMGGLTPLPVRSALKLAGYLAEERKVS